MAQYEHLPIFKQMLELTVHIEKAVRPFSRYHKYTLGSELRGFCHHGLGLIAEANSTRDRSALLLELRNTLERLKIHLILAKEVGWALPTKNPCSLCNDMVGNAHPTMLP